MRTITTVKNIYTWNELSDDDKEKAIEKLHDINVNREWWDFTYMDAENIGLKINSFDLDRASYVNGDFIGSAMDTALAIIKEHGDNCDTYQTAKDYLVEHKALIAAQCQDEADFLCLPMQDEIDIEVIKYNQEELDIEDIDKEFLRMLCEDYRIILQNEYDYLTSDQAIIETIEANEWEFTENGEMV